jgi:hypothetical protein
MRTTKALFIIIAVYGTLYVFTVAHSLWASQSILHADTVTSPDIEKAHLDYIDMAIAQTKIALGALIGALSSALTIIFQPKEKTES